MDCKIVINQQPSSPPRCGRENYMAKLKEKLLKDNEKTQMTLNL